MENNIIFEPQCIVDSGKIFYSENKVFRAIKLEQDALFYKKLLDSGVLKDAFDSGLLVKTVISEKVLDGYSLVLEHEKIDFFLHPSEMTNLMYWKCARAFIDLCIKLNEVGLILKDAHPWNMTFHKGAPIFFDFTSIVAGTHYDQNWFDEFYTYFAVPLRLGVTKWSYLAKEYRRQHTNGFGLTLFKNKLIKRVFFFNLLGQNISKQSINNSLIKLKKWVNKYKPVTQSGAWDSYNQSHDADFMFPKTIKQKFVYDIIAKTKPKKVCDLASNKGYYSRMASFLSSKVIAFDYEEYCIDVAYEGQNNENITFAQMDFNYPTPAFGIGLIGQNSYKRFLSDISLALGLIHHICLVQRIPVESFCRICSEYGKKGCILEYVDPEDVHVEPWKVKIPDDYNKEAIKKYFSKYYKTFCESEVINYDGVKRQLFYFFN